MVQYPDSNIISTVRHPAKRITPQQNDIYFAGADGMGTQCALLVQPQPVGAPKIYVQMDNQPFREIDTPEGDWYNLVARENGLDTPHQFHINADLRSATWNGISLQGAFAPLQIEVQPKQETRRLVGAFENSQGRRFVVSVDHDAPLLLGRNSSTALDARMFRTDSTGSISRVDTENGVIEQQNPPRPGDSVRADMNWIQTPEGTLNWHVNRSLVTTTATWRPNVGPAEPLRPLDTRSIKFQENSFEAALTPTRSTANDSHGVGV
jgi:hypothetical protein